LWAACLSFQIFLSAGRRSYLSTALISLPKGKGERLYSGQAKRGVAEDRRRTAEEEEKRGRREGRSARAEEEGGRGRGGRCGGRGCRRSRRRRGTWR